MLVLIPSLSATRATTTNTSLLIPDYEIMCSLCAEPGCNWCVFAQWPVGSTFLFGSRHMHV